MLLIISLTRVIGYIFLEVIYLCNTWISGRDRVFNNVLIFICLANLLKSFNYTLTQVERIITPVCYKLK